VNEATATQLRLIGKIRDALDAAGVAWWLYGGWAVDFHAGEVTRDHSDIEIFVRLEDAAAAKDALVGAGFAAPPGLHPDEGQPFLKDGQEVSATYLAGLAGGDPRVPGRWADWPFPARAFDEPRVLLGAIEAPVMSAEGLLDMKLGFAAQPHGAPPREKDRADVARLRAIIASRSEDDW
jgi:hypothetical protein